MRWNQLRGSRASTRSPSSMSRAGGHASRWRARPGRRGAAVGISAEAQGPVERPCRRPDPASRRQQGERGGDRQDRDGRDLDDVLGDVAAQAVHGDAEPLVRVGALDAEDVDDVVTVEAVGAGAGGPRAVGHAHDAGGEGGGHRPALERQRRASDAEHAGARRLQRAVGEQSPLDRRLTPSA